MCPGARFTNGFSIAIQIRWEFRFALTSIRMQWSLQNFVHGTTALLSWHVQKFVAIWWPATELWQGEVSIEFELQKIGKKTLVKRAPGEGCNNRTIEICISLCPGNGYNLQHWFAIPIRLILRQNDAYMCQYICVSKLIIIWNNAGILLIWTLGTNFRKILSEIHTLMKMHFKMGCAKWQQFCQCIKANCSEVVEGCCFECFLFLWNISHQEILTMHQQKLQV